MVIKIRTLQDDLVDGGCKGQFYTHQHSQHNLPETNMAVYLISEIRYFSFDRGVIARANFYDNDGNCLLTDKFIFLGDRLTDRRASSEISDRILALEKVKDK